MNRLRAFCDRLCDRLFESIERYPALNRVERRALRELWMRATVKTQTVEDYPGHEAFAAGMGVARRRLMSALMNLERKGFIKATGSLTTGRRLAYLLNALLLEAAFDDVRDQRHQ
jgi:hypothetical protein